MAKQEKAEQGDVLLYHDSARRLGVVWNDLLPKGSKGATVPMQHRHVIQPRLGFCPGRLWARVSGSPAYKDAVRYGDIAPLAGHDGGDLDVGIAEIYLGKLIGMVERSAGLQTLDRLQAVETASANPRLELSEAIELRKKDLAVEIAKAKRGRDHERRANQRKIRRRRVAA